MKHTGTQQKEKSLKKTTKNKSDNTTGRNKGIGERKEDSKGTGIGSSNANKTTPSKIMKETWWRMYKGKSSTRGKRNKKIWNKIWKRKEHNRNSEWMNDMKKESEILKEGL